MRQIVYSISLFILVIIMSCKGEENSEISSDENQTVEADTLVKDSLDQNILLEEGVYTAEAMLDGPDEWFYVMQGGEFEVNVEELPEFDVLHIVPYAYGSDQDEHEIHDYMMAISVEGFILYSPFNEFAGRVVVFYDRAKEKVAVDYNIKNGKPVGEITLRNPEGEVYIERQYDMNTSEWVSSGLEPFGADWTFSQSESVLFMNNKKNAYTMEGDVEVVSIMPTNHPTKDTDNRLYTIMEKASFQSPFQINYQIFTGRLRAYFSPNTFEPSLYYELNFKEGWLDGEVKIYDEWGSLRLHELFVMGDLDSTLYVAEYEDGVAKPIIYLYPEEDMLVDVKLDFEGRITHTYPKYNKGWSVFAKTDGTLFDETGKEYYSLYWEGQEKNDFTISEGFVVEGSKTITFLEKALEALNLNRREANEFIIYWLPMMENNPYNLIHFSTTEYEEMAQLHISPKPETFIRVMMVFQPLDEKIDFPLQDISTMRVERKGFTVVEWGGKKLSNQKVLF